MKAVCLHCNTTFKFNNKVTRGKFCSNTCQGQYRYKQHRDKFFRGVLVTIDRKTVRNYLRDMRGYQCELCKISTWQNLPITLQVDHANGDPSNNSPSNLRLLCPNCHSQTSSYAGGNRGSGRKARGLKLN